MTASTKTVVPQQITFPAELQFDVSLRGLETNDGLIVPVDRGVVRTNPDGTELVMAVVGGRYEIQDHRNLLRQFGESLRNSNINFNSTFRAYRNGARIFGRYLFTDPVSFISEDSKKHDAFPYLTFTTSHDGSLKIGFLLGATINGVAFNISKKTYSVEVKHLAGAKIGKVLIELPKALSVFNQEVVPLWRQMMLTKLSAEQAKTLIEKATKKNIISEKRVKELKQHVSVWDLYTDVVQLVSKPSKTGTDEEGFWRNASANEFFIKQLSELAGN